MLPKAKKGQEPEEAGRAWRAWSGSADSLTLNFQPIELGYIHIHLHIHFFELPSMFAVPTTGHPWGMVSSALTLPKQGAGLMLLCVLERTLSRLDSQRHYVGFVKLDGWKGGVFPPSLEMPGGSRMS